MPYRKPYPAYTGFIHELKPKRRAPLLAQYKAMGFDDTELWSLDCSIAAFILPRLIRFKKLNAGVPYKFTNKQWKAELSKMIAAFKIISNNVAPYTPTQQKAVDEGLESFKNNLTNLWT